jgi:NADH:ubiquinone oxidoreductase subunit D
MKSRVSLVRWLYLIHNKVNKKLNINTGPTLKQVWNKYESFRSKCTKSPEIVEKIKTGCLDPLKGYRKKCVIDVIDVDEKGNEFLHPYDAKDKRVYVAIESPRGEIGCYIVSDGGPKPYRIHMRAPSFVNIQALPHMMRGGLVADAVAVISSIDPVLGEVDR